MAEEKEKVENKEEMISEEENEQQVSEEEQSEIDEAEDRIKQLEEELAATKETILRKAAELDNVRKRVQRERIQLFEEAKAGALEDFLPISDDLLRTIEASKELDLDENFMKGLNLVADKFNEVLKKHGVSRIDEAGVPFDVNLHDAMMKQPSADKDIESDMVLQVLESGYKIGDRTIRHAKVIVSE